MEMELREGFLDTWQPDAKQFNGILAGLNEALVIYNDQKHLTYINVAALSEDYRYLYPRAGETGHEDGLELIDETGEKLSPKAWPLKRLFQDESFDALELSVRVNGRRRIHSVSGWLVRQDSALYVLKALDITERREAEARFSTCFNDTPIPTLLLSLDKLRVIDANKSFLEMTGFERDEVIGQPLAALELFKSEDFDVLDRHFHDTDGAQEVQEVKLHTRKGESCYIALSNQPVTVNGEACLLGTLLDISERKRTEEQLMQALQEVMQDTAWFSRSVMEKLAQIRQSPETPQVTVELTKRERQLLELIAKGLSNGQIEAQLGLAKTTVRNYVSRIYDKLGVHSRAEAIVWARERGVVA